LGVVPGSKQQLFETGNPRQPVGELDPDGRIGRLAGR
jgi:hypothetical protein